MAKLTKAQARVLRDLAAGGSVHACFNEPDDFLQHGRLFHESTIIVHRAGNAVADRYRVRNKTISPLHECEPMLINHEPGDSGLRCFTITDAGREALRSSEPARGEKTP